MGHPQSKVVIPSAVSIGSSQLLTKTWTLFPPTQGPWLPNLWQNGPSPPVSLGCTTLSPDPRPAHVVPDVCSHPLDPANTHWASLSLDIISSEESFLMPLILDLEPVTYRSCHNVYLVIPNWINGPVLCWFMLCAG